MYESSLLACHCHPHLPLLFGVCTQSKPLRIVMQLHAWEGLKPSTMSDMLEMQDDQFDVWLWILLLAQFVNAMVYLHSEVRIIHNDIKTDNILITQSIPSCMMFID